MIDLFTDEVRRNPFAAYESMRRASPVWREPQSGIWMLFDYASVKRALTDHQVFSSKYGPDWPIFSDPPRHTKLRALIARAFTPRSIANLTPRIRQLSCALLDDVIESGEMDLAAQYSVALPMMVIAEMLGIPLEHRARFKRWTDVILNMSYTVPGGEDAARATSEFVAASAEMTEYLAGVLEQRRSAPTDDLLSRLVHAEIDGERLSNAEIVGFFQLLLLAGSETTTNLINNAMLCFVDHRGELARLLRHNELLTSAIEEVLRYRSPVQWMYRPTLADVEMRGERIPAASLVLAVMGAANHDPEQFEDPQSFDVGRDPNPHIAFGHGIHFCLGAALGRLEASIALSDLLRRVKDFDLASNTPWEPRKGLHVHGPTHLPIRFAPGAREEQR